ncbi:MAG: hypothetical protein LBC33_02125 [Mycoplasmataceae bacterium]|jgi:hypothetical protein|nr:hypothetical protein [Mycoplasmataceae bacterium]
MKQIKGKFTTVQNHQSLNGKQFTALIESVRLPKPKRIKQPSLREIVINGFARVNDKLTEHGKRFTVIERRLDVIERRLDEIDARLDGVDERFERHNLD